MYLLDTNVISELRKIDNGKANPGVVQWASSVNAEALYLSSITVAEIETGVGRMERRDSEQGGTLREWFENYVLNAFEGRIIPMDNIVARRLGEIQVQQPRPTADAIIAATALVHRMAVVTRNVKDFQVEGLQLINPWER